MNCLLGSIKFVLMLLHCKGIEHHQLFFINVKYTKILFINYSSLLINKVCVFLKVGEIPTFIPVRLKWFWTILLTSSLRVIQFTIIQFISSCHSLGKILPACHSWRHYPESSGCNSAENGLVAVHARMLEKQILQKIAETFVLLLFLLVAFLYKKCDRKMEAGLPRWDVCRQCLLRGRRRHLPVMVNSNP